MKWWQIALIVVYHLAFAYAVGSQIKGAPLF
jgi:hypothetical protein